MSDRKLLMPKATAVWLVENTSLTFEQIAELCGLHVLEVKGIADGDVAQGIKGMDPISTGQLTREEIATAEEDHGTVLRLAAAEGRIPEVKSQEGPALYAGVAPPGPAQRGAVAAAQSSRAEGQPDHAPRRHDQADDRRDPRPHALELAQPAPQDPVTLGLCSQIDLDAEVKKARGASTASARTGAEARRRPARCCRPKRPSRARAQPEIDAAQDRRRSARRPRPRKRRACSPSSRSSRVARMTRSRGSRPEPRPLSRFRFTFGGCAVTCAALFHSRGRHVRRRAGCPREVAC